MKESLAEMMARVNDGMPSAKWIQTSVGLVNMGNENASMLAGERLAKLRAAKANGGEAK